ncbi:hypothetical protein GGF32_006755 [Allomyces javanicus]|nr:hypothetical protein GGF32_006755 [Allomyces javanicus]
MAPPTNASMFSPGGDGDMTDSNTAIHTADAVKYLLHGPAPGGAEPSIDYAALRLALDREEVDYRSYGTRSPSPSPKTPDHLKSQRAPRPAWAVEEEERQRQDQQMRFGQKPYQQQQPPSTPAARQPSPLRPAALRNFPDIPADTPSRSPSPPAPSFLNRTDGPFASYRPPPPRSPAPPAVEDMSTTIRQRDIIAASAQRAPARSPAPRSPSPSAAAARTTSPPSTGPLPDPNPPYTEFHIPSPGTSSPELAHLASHHRHRAPSTRPSSTTSAARSSPIMPELRRAANRAARDRARSTSARGHEDLSSSHQVLPEVPYPVSRKRAHRTAAAAGRGRTVTGDSSEASGAPSVTSVPSSMSRSASSVTTPSSSYTSSRSSRSHHRTAAGAAAAARSRALRELSEFMQSTGLPPLPPNVVDAKLPEGVQVSLDHAIPHVMNEFNRRGDLIRELVQRLSKEEEEEIARRRVRDAIKAAGGSGVDTTQIDRILAQKGGGKNHVEDLRIKYEQVRAQAERDATEAQALRDELQTVTTKSAAQQRRAEQSFQTVAAQFRKPGHGALDQVTTEVVDVYERKVDGLQQEIKNLRDQVRKMTRPEGGHSPAPPMLDEVPAPPDQFLRLKHTLEQQIGLLQKKIDEQQKVIHRVEEERDLLKLQLVNFEKIKTIAGPQRAERDLPHPPAPPTGGSTRDRIRRDKLHFQLKLYEIDAMPAEQCRDVLKDVCIRLHVKDVHTVVDALEEVAKVVHMVPKMQQYIRQVDELVWRRPLVDPADKALNRKPNADKKSANPQGIHAVRDTFRVLQFWAQELEALDHARTYRTRLFQLLGVDPDRLPGETPDEDAELMAIEEIKRLLAFEKNTHRRETRQLATATGEGTSPEATYARVVSHFCNLFEVSTLADAFPKLNELFVFTTEVENGLRRLRDVLGVGEGVPVTPAAVLNRAADELLVRVSGASFRVENAEDVRDMDRVPVTFSTTEPKSRPHTGTPTAPNHSPVAMSASAISSFMRAAPPDLGRSNAPNDVLRDLEQLLDRVSHEEAELMDEDADLELPSFLRRSPSPTRRGVDDYEDGVQVGGA